MKRTEMQLQKEIKTSKFENVYQQAIVNVVFTYSWCNENFRQLIQPYEITPQQFNILRILRGQYPAPSTINLLKERMLDKMCDASRITERLVQKELVAKKINPNDKRAVDILISDKGLSLLKKMDQELDLSAPVSKNLTEEEATLLNELLDKMRG
ncbi:DNA-binding transcriptional regulator, MarR family [Pedobacter steynii]|uniref:DNA-binding transcriptional regulator, MarR family n=1 Tax=Pedobacter steynii TaxID=430522 RepID=A0A1G9S4Z3_9SPHI|nr:MarR family transcriptional regulator [Pedobacter steynii]SDM30461.1 DNA-binding transcriptional regulator, MarR family [Pedobacter steynii]